MPGAILISKGRKMVIGTVPVLKEFKYVSVDWSSKMLSAWMTKVSVVSRGHLTQTRKRKKKPVSRNFQEQVKLQLNRRLVKWATETQVSPVLTAHSPSHDTYLKGKQPLWLFRPPDEGI